jgi:hypothetical protein
MTKVNHELPTGGCEQKQKLITAYSDSIAGYAAAVNDLHITRRKSLKKDYERLRLLAEDARETVEGARLALDWHTQEHGC